MPKRENQEDVHNRAATGDTKMVIPESSLQKKKFQNKKKLKKAKQVVPFNYIDDMEQAKRKINTIPDYKGCIEKMQKISTLKCTVGHELAIKDAYEDFLTQDTQSLFFRPSFYVYKETVNL